MVETFSLKLFQDFVERNVQKNKTQYTLTCVKKSDGLRHAAVTNHECNTLKPGEVEQLPFSELDGNFCECLLDIAVNHPSNALPGGGGWGAAFRFDSLLRHAMRVEKLQKLADESSPEVSSVCDLWEAIFLLEINLVSMGGNKTSIPAKELLGVEVPNVILPYARDKYLDLIGQKEVREAFTAAVQEVKGAFDGTALAVLERPYTPFDFELDQYGGIYLSTRIVGFSYGGITKRDKLTSVLVDMFLSGPQSVKTLPASAGLLLRQEAVSGGTFLIHPNLELSTSEIEVIRGIYPSLTEGSPLLRLQKALDVALNV